MKVADYRDLVRALCQLTNDWHACVSDHERQAWSCRAARVHAELEAAACPRVTPRDLELRNLALQRYRELACHPLQDAALRSNSAPMSRPNTPSTQRVGTTRAAGYNRSAARAVRLSRAARSAMRRGYF